MVLLGALLLMVVFRSLLIPLQAAVMNVLTIGASLGVTVVVFKHGSRWRAPRRCSSVTREWHYIRWLGRDLGPFESVSNEDIEAAIVRFSATLPPEYRRRALPNASPLHVTPRGVND